MTLDEVCAQILDRPAQPHRRLVAIAGPPASGKSTLAQELAARLNDLGAATTVVPMDGFHLDDRLLRIDGTQDRKGAPGTFDADGFCRLIGALQSRASVVFPIFDRSREIAIAGAGRVPAQCRTVVVEGNYLLLDAAPWNSLRGAWAYSIALHPPEELLRDRLLDRWAEHGKPDAQSWIDGNDMPNIRTVLNTSALADLTLSEPLS